MNIEHYHYSGKELLGKVRPGERVVCIGPGESGFARRIPNFTEINIEQQTVQQFITDNSAQKFNIAFCLDSVFTEEDIALVVKLLRERDSRIYWRTTWDHTQHIRLAEQFNYQIIELEQDLDRTYAEWISKNVSATY